jgi:hypothetical protein
VPICEFGSGAELGLQHRFSGEALVEAETESEDDSDGDDSDDDDSDKEAGGGDGGGAGGDGGGLAMVNHLQNVLVQDRMGRMQQQMAFQQTLHHQNMLNLI